MLLSLTWLINPFILSLIFSELWFGWCSPLNRIEWSISIIIFSINNHVLIIQKLLTSMKYLKSNLLHLTPFNVFNICLELNLSNLVSQFPDINALSLSSHHQFINSRICACDIYFIRITRLLIFFFRLLARYKAFSGFSSSSYEDALMIVAMNEKTP